ncbi:hypothetical protein NA57DRAFT_27902, partial [Rhizodiscina lignyota]
PKSLQAELQAFWQRNKGLLLVVLSQLFATLMNTTTRVLEVEGNHGNGMHPFQILFWRMSVTSILASIYLWRQKTPDFLLGAKGIRLLMLGRSLGGCFGVLGMYYSLMYLPIADATVVTFLAPSLACWACSFILKESFTRIQQLAALVSLVGVVLIARPWSPSLELDMDVSHMMDVINSTLVPVPAIDLQPHVVVSAGQRAGAVAVAMLGVLGNTLAITTIRWIGKRASPLQTVNTFSFWCAVLAALAMVAVPGIGFVLPSAWQDWTYLAVITISGYLMQFVFAAGLQHESSTRVTCMVYTQMVFAIAADLMVFGTGLNLMSVAGSALILVSSVYIAV